MNCCCYLLVAAIVSSRATAHIGLIFGLNTSERIKYTWRQSNGGRKHTKGGQAWRQKKIYNEISDCVLTHKLTHTKGPAQFALDYLWWNFELMGTLEIHLSHLRAV